MRKKAGNSPMWREMYGGTLISSPDLVLAVRGQKTGKGGGKGRGGTRSGRIRIETSADWLFHNGRESSTRVLFLSVAVPKTR